MKHIGELKVPELHDELTRRGLPKKGKKPELIERLSAYLSEQGKDPSQFDFDEPASHEDTGGDKEMTDEPVTSAQDVTPSDATVTEVDKEETQVTTDASLDVVESKCMEGDDSSVDKATAPPVEDAADVTPAKIDDSSAPPVEVFPECTSGGDAEMTSLNKAANENAGEEPRDEVQSENVATPSDDKEGMC